MKSAEKEQTRINNGLPRLGVHQAVKYISLQVFQYYHSISAITVKQCDSLPDPSSAQEHQKCLWSSCETQADVSSQTEGQNGLISAFCYRLRMKVIHLLITNNKYIFSGVGIWNKILKPHTFLCRPGWGF